MEGRYAIALRLGLAVCMISAQISAGSSDQCSDVLLWWCEAVSLGYFRVLTE